MRTSKHSSLMWIECSIVGNRHVSALKDQTHMESKTMTSAFSGIMWGPALAGAHVRLIRSHTVGIADRWTASEPRTHVESNTMTSAVSGNHVGASLSRRPRKADTIPYSRNRPLEIALFDAHALQESLATEASGELSAMHPGADTPCAPAPSRVSCGWMGQKT